MGISNNLDDKNYKNQKVHLDDIQELKTVGASPKEIYKRTTQDYQPKPEACVKIEKTLKSFEHEKAEQFAFNKAEYLGMPYVNLFGKHIPAKALMVIPQEIAKKYQIIPYFIKDNNLWVAALDPENQDMVAEVLKNTRKQGLDVSLAVTSSNSMEYALKNYEHIIIRKPEPENIQISGGSGQSIQQKISSINKLREQIKKVSASQLLNVLISGAEQVRASDIHIEPREKSARVRYRIDGILHSIVELPKDPYKLLQSRIKFLAKLKLDLTNTPQDGHFSVMSENKKIDIRVASLPTVYGENLVLRLLTQEKHFKSLKDLGFNLFIQKLVIQVISKPHGMILNTGPTGSGKTTTLYAILDYLNKPGVKIITLEDPVEYKIQGINQSQIDASAGYGFAEGMRSVVRQDPDIIMVGEIRDRETAKIAIQAAQTGHLVLSTLHTNSAIATIVRLVEIGVEPYLLSGAINLIIAQRLVRKICTYCVKEYTPDPETVQKIKEIWDKAPKDFKENRTMPSILHKGAGCDKCNNTGYLGRIPIAEAFTPNQVIENAVLNRKSNSEIYKLARENGMVNILEDGVSKVIDGVTTIDEVWRVAKE